MYNMYGYATNRPQFFFRTADVTGTCTLPEKVEMVCMYEHMLNNQHLNFI